METIISVQDPDVLCITETLPKYRPALNLADYQCNFVNYNGYHCITGRGVSVYVRDQIKSEVVPSPNKFSDMLWLLLTLKNKSKLLLGCIYRSPNSTEQNNNLLLELLGIVCKKHPNNIMITGDFNLKEINWDNHTVSANANHIATKFYDEIQNNFLTQLVKEPTRYRQGEQANILDLILTDTPELINNIKICPPLGDKGDHNVILFEYDVPPENIPQAGKFSYYKGNYNEMAQLLEGINWELELNHKDSGESWTLFHKQIQELMYRFIPTSKGNRKKRNLWINTEYKQAVRDKNKVWNTYKKNKSIDNWESFKHIRNRTNKIIKKQKLDFETKIAQDIKHNPKRFWAYVNSKISQNREFPTLVDPNGKSYECDKEKADLFNNYFSSVYTIEDTTNPIPKPSVINNDCEISDIVCSPTVVLKQLNKINISKAAGPDELHPKVLAELKNNINIPLSIIFTKSLEECKLPSQWKHAIVRPLYKKGTKSSPQNYRPVSLTSVCGKLLEKIVRDNIVIFLEENKLLSKDQHGFRQGRSCTTQLLEIMEIWTDLLENRCDFDCIYLDFAKAFDKVPHKRLLNKVEGMGIKGRLLLWIKDFLANRTQVVALNKVQSEPIKVTSGIPQGSVLGPILFLIYINDLPHEINSYTKIFADDTKIFKAISSIADNYALQEDLDRLISWSQKWQLPFNIEKCKLLHYGSKNQGYNYTMEGKVVLKETEEKDLGVLFDTKLKFTKHIRAIVNKANSRIGIIKRHFTNLSTTIFLPLYKALIRPLLEYCSSIWTPILIADSIEIEKVQRRATKLVYNVRNLSYENRLKELKLDSIKFRRRRTDILQVYRIVHGIDNIPLDNFFEINSDTRTRGHNFKLKKVRINTRIRQHSFSQRTINDWNSLSEKAVNSQSLNSFKTHLSIEWKDHPDRFCA